MAALNATQASLLGFLHDGPKTGWDLLDEVSRGLARFWNVTSSHVYRELKTLEGRGLIEAGPTGPRDRQPYAITADGKTAFAAWLHTEPGPEQIRVPLLVTLWFGKHLDAATLAGFVDTHRVMHEQRLDEYRSIKDTATDADPHISAVVEFGIAYEEAFLRWLAELEFSDPLS
ncbi:MAG: PadR family transcriptional regulator [Actinomycetia bacterium]|nr:PadR family transcriptional regulator [Actinomycetes bacterium]